MPCHGIVSRAMPGLASICFESCPAKMLEPKILVAGCCPPDNVSRELALDLGKQALHEAFWARKELSFSAGTFVKTYVMFALTFAQCGQTKQVAMFAL